MYIHIHTHIYYTLFRLIVISIIKGDFNLTNIFWFVQNTVSNHNTAAAKLLLVSHAAMQLTATC